MTRRTESFIPQLTLFAAVEEAPDTTLCLQAIIWSCADVQLGVGVDAVHAGVVSAGVLVGVGADNACLVRLLKNIVQYSTVQYCTVRYGFRFNSTGFR